MIRLNIDTAISIYCCLSVFLVIAFWIFYNYKSAGSLINNDKSYLQQCSFCMHVFFNYQNKEIIICPLCKSLIQTEKEGGNIIG